MSKNAWVTLVVIIVVLVSLALVLMLLLVPQSNSHLTGIVYDSIAKEEYTYEDTKYDPQKEENWEMHEIDATDIRNGEKTGSYDPGNTNPFTPPKDITIYNEPGYTGGSTNNSGSSGTNGSTGSSGGTTAIK